MFFATYVLTQKGPLAKVWLAAHWDKKLTSKDVKVIDLKQTIVHVVQPSVPIALRTSGELMLGIVRIYALKVANLLKDATEATSVLLKPRAINVVKVPLTQAQQQQKLKNGGGDENATHTNAIAITMDVTVGRIGADELCDADFAEVADLLNNNDAAVLNNNNKKKADNNNNKNKDDANNNNSWWFATDAAQAVEEIQYASRHDAEMAKFRAELDKTSAAGSSKSGTSGSSGAASVEQGRANANANNAAATADADGFIPPSAEDEQNFLMGAAGTLDGNAVLDLDAVLDNAAGVNNNNNNMMPEMNLEFNTEDGAQQQQDQQNQQQQQKQQRKLRMVIVVDAETSLKPEALKKMADNRSDIVNSERRHGPLDESEVQDRAVLRDEAIVSDCSPLSCYFNNDVLRAAFHAAVQAVATERISEIERLRGGNNAAGAAGKNNKKNNNNKKDDQDGLVMEEQNNNNNQFPTFDDEAFNNMMMMGGENNNNELPDLSADATAVGQRRGRHHDEDADRQRDDAFSASTLATLKYLREKLLAAGAKATSFRAMTQGQNKQTACRTFVDLLHLASHQFVGVAQKEPFGVINVTRGPKFATTAK